jgi:signal transduction histidine kinase
MAKKNLTPEMLVPRLGEYLVQQGHITNEQLKQALGFQKKKAKTQTPYLIGQALVELGLIDKDTLDEAITEQIIQLRTALENANRFLERRVQERTADLQEALRKLSELSQLKANFVANISHELRTPLTHVKGYLELLITEALGPISEEQYKALEVSQRAATRLENLMENLIMFSLASRGEMTLHLGEVNLNKVASEIIGYTKQKAVDKNITLTVDIQPDLPFVQADEEMISWAILQLLDNAVKFTPMGGEVTLSIQAESETLVQVTVSDTGIGIPEDSKTEIFEPFHQLDGSSTRKHGGTGIGLTLVREILDAHGSVIDVQSVREKGSSFRFPLIVAGKK